MAVSSHHWAAIAMTAAAGLHKFGYEFVRAVSTTLFTDRFGSHMLPLALVFVPITAALLLTVYHALIVRIGPQLTLVSSVVLTCCVLLGCAGTLHDPQTHGAAVFVLYVFREAYVTFLSSQFWSYMASCLQLSDASSWFGIALGMTSLFSSFAGVAIGYWPISDLQAVVFTVACLAITLPFAHVAYTLCAVAPGRTDHGPQGAKPSTCSSSWDIMGLRSLEVSPVLPILFRTTIIMQALATTVTLVFNHYLRAQYVDASGATAFTGLFFAATNGISAAVQFIGVRVLLRKVPITTALFYMPLGVLGASVALVLFPGLTFAAALLLTFKVTEYAAFATIKEVLYVPLSYEARFVAKEVIDVLAYRLGKGGTSLALAVLSPFFTVPPYGFAILSTVGAVVWTRNVRGLQSVCVASHLLDNSRPPAGDDGRESPPPNGTLDPQAAYTTPDNTTKKGRPYLSVRVGVDRNGAPVSPTQPYQRGGASPKTV